MSFVITSNHKLDKGQHVGAVVLAKVIRIIRLPRIYQQVSLELDVDLELGETA